MCILHRKKYIIVQTPCPVIENEIESVTKSMKGFNKIPEFFS